MIFSDLSYRWQIYRQERFIRDRDAFYRKKIAKARKDGESAEAIHEIGRDQWLEEEYTYDAIGHLQHRRLGPLARKYNIATPDFNRDNGTWVESEVRGGRWRWSASVMEELYRKVREEQHRRSQARAIYIGIIGALTGLLSVLYQFPDCRIP